MMTSSDLIEILFLAGVVAFIAFRLYSVLGKRTGAEQHPYDPINQRERIEARRPAAPEDNVVNLPPRPRDVPTRARSFHARPSHRSRNRRG